jgi:hypothetical protein
MPWWEIIIICIESLIVGLIVWSLGARVAMKIFYPEKIVAYWWPITAPLILVLTMCNIVKYVVNRSLIWLKK